MWIAGAVLALLLYYWILQRGRRLVARRYTVYTDKPVPALRIAVLADLHGNAFGADNEELFALICAHNPDIVVYTGDNIKDQMPIDSVAGFLTRTAEKYPSYYVTGNHELRYALDRESARLMAKCGIADLCDKAVKLAGGAAVVCGVNDPQKDRADFPQRLARMRKICGPDAFSILLSHRPEYAEAYAALEFDLVLCGHAHGGQWRIPGVLNGLLAPDQGLFPKYAGGQYALGGKTMIVSRGLATQYMIPRIFNPTELVVVDILPVTQA